MRTFDSVIGHREIIEHLQNAVRMGKVSHAYLISGEEGSGKNCWPGSLQLRFSVKGAERIPAGSALPVRKQKVETIRILSGSPMKNHRLSAWRKSAISWWMMWP